MENKKSVGTIALVVLLLIVTIAALILATFAWAKYTTTLPQTSTNAVVARWNITGNSTDLTWSKTFSHVVGSRLAPGTNGTIPVNFSINNTEVDVDYTITLVSAVNKPTNLHFYTDNTKTTEITVGGTAYTGRLEVGDSAINPAIYWEWPYETGEDNDAIAANDITDTNEGIAAQTMTVTIRIDAVQVQPQ